MLIIPILGARYRSLEIPGPARIVHRVSSRFSERYCLKTQGGEYLRKASDVTHLPFTHIHACEFMCTLRFSKSQREKHPFVS